MSAAGHKRPPERTTLAHRRLPVRIRDRRKIACHAGDTHASQVSAETSEAEKQA